MVALATERALVIVAESAVRAVNDPLEPDMGELVTVPALKSTPDRLSIFCESDMACHTDADC